MRYLMNKLDKKYSKICIYASATVLITVALLGIIYYSGDFWRTLWQMFKALIIPIFIGGLLSILFLPVIEKIEKAFSSEHKRWTRPLATAIFYVVLVVILVGIIAGLSFALKGGIQSFGEFSLAGLKDLIYSFYNRFESLIKSLQSDIMGSALPFKKIANMLPALVSGLSNFFSNLLFAFIFSIFFILDEANIRNYWGRVIKIICGEKVFDTANSLADEAIDIFSLYMKSQLTDCLLVGTITSISFIIAGIPYGLIIGIAVGLGNLIPYIGPVIGYAATIIICLATGHIDKMIIGLVILIIIMFVDGNVINPMLLSTNIEIHPLLVIAALIGGGAFGGIAGMIIAVPVATIIKIEFEKFLDYSEKKRAESSIREEEESAS